MLSFIGVGLVTLRFPPVGPVAIAEDERIVARSRLLAPFDNASSSGVDGRTYVCIDGFAVLAVDALLFSLAGETLVPELLAESGFFAADGEVIGTDGKTGTLCPARLGGMQAWLTARNFKELRYCRLLKGHSDVSILQHFWL